MNRPCPQAPTDPIPGIPTPRICGIPTIPGLLGEREVLRALLRRRGGGPGGRSGGRSGDGHRIALVVSGGGMRGAYPGGMVHALEDAGLGGCFDVVYGSSAGAFIGAALLVGHGRGAAHIFFEDMACRAFIDPRRLPARRPMVSLDHVLATVEPVEWERLRDSPVPLRVIATAADDLTPHVLEPRTVDDWKLALRATASIPLLAGRPVTLHGRSWIDGSVAEPLPVLRALADGATHVLALGNRTLPDLRRGDQDGGPVRWARALDRLAPGLGAIARESHRHGPMLAVLDEPHHPGRRGARLLMVAPEHDVGVRGLTTDPVRVERAAKLGYATMAAALELALGGVQNPTAHAALRG